MRRARAPALPGPDAPLPPGPLPPASCIQGEGSAAGGGKRGSDAGLAPPLITPRQERLQAPLASTVTAALTPCTQGQGPGADSGLSAAVTFPRQTRCSCRSPGAAGGCSGVAALPGGEAAPQTPQCRWGPRGVAARHGTGGCPRGKGVKGCACSRVSSLRPMQGLGSICRDEARTRQDGEGWPCSAELRAPEGRGGRPPSAGSTADLWDGQAGCAAGVPCPLEKMPVWEFASGRAVQAELFLLETPTLCAPDTSGELLVPAEPAQGQWRWGHCPQVGTEQPGFACEAALGAGAHSHTHTVLQ